MKDEKNREQGKYTEKYFKMYNGVNTEITEETKVGRDFEILSFARTYNPPVPYENMKE